MSTVQGIAGPRPVSAPLSKKEVESLQRELEAAGFDPGLIDGILGRATRDALREFQKASGLKPNGIPDAATRTALAQAAPSESAERAWVAKPGVAPIPTATTAGAPKAVATLQELATVSPPLKAGSHGPQVLQLQQALKSLGYTLAIDGAYGPGTTAALRSFAAHSLPGVAVRGDVVTPELANALALQSERPAFSAALSRLSDTMMAAWPPFYEQTEGELRGILSQPTGPARDAALEGWMETLDGRFQHDAAALDKFRPGWANDWAAVKAHFAQAAQVPGGVSGEVPFAKDIFEATAKKRLVENIQKVSDGLRQVDPQLTVQFANLLDGLENTSGGFQSDGFKSLVAFMRQNKAQLEKELPPEARRAWIELHGTLDDAERTGQVKPLTDFMLENYLQHTLDAIKAGPNVPGTAQLTDALKARLQKLEAAAAPNAGKQLTGEMLQRIAKAVGGNPTLTAARAAELARAFNEAMQKAGITTMREKAAFIAQCAQETGGFQWFHELGPNSYFDKYDNRRDLGNRGHPDGATFKGRGALQITGRTNYTAYSKWAYGDDRAVRSPQLLEQPLDAFASAGWYWDSRGLNKPADANNFKLVTERINGGLNGEDNRLKYYTRALTEFAQS
ncbi:MAG TPA: peptidoglycan-binding protein, partial [Myxococcaceae bacterium]|nr:peptidoglycan-binding protein [Myxococcaceae bacterium]